MRTPHPTPDQRAHAAIRCTWIGAVLDTVLGIAKIMVGWLFHSHALIADGIHSLSDVVTDFMVVIVVRMANVGPDKEHPYGHERFETVGTVFLGFLLVAVAGAMAYNSIQQLYRGSDIQVPGWPTLIIAALSIVGKEAIYRYTLTIGKRLKSDLLIANAWHSRSDAYSSIIVFVGIAGAIAGLPWLDSLAALAVAVFVAKIGWDLSWKSLQELVDTAIEPETTQAIHDTAMKVDGIEGVHSFKSRQMGSKKLLEMHLQVRPYISTSEAHYLGDRVVQEILKHFDDVGHIIFHIDTENDTDAHVCQLLPDRASITHEIDGLLQQLAPRLQRQNLVLHYLQGRVEIDLMVTQQAVVDAAQTATTPSSPSSPELSKALNNALSSHSWFRHLNLWHDN